MICTIEKTAFGSTQPFTAGRLNDSCTDKTTNRHQGVWPTVLQVVFTTNIEHFQNTPYSSMVFTISFLTVLGVFGHGSDN